MDQMITSKALRLRSHLDKYLVANDDGTANVRQSRNHITRRSIWVVEPSPSPKGASFLRLKNHSTGLYLAASDAAAFFLTGKRVVQSPLILHNKNLKIGLIFDWEPIRDDGAKIKLKARGEQGKFLRANSGPPPWNNSVTHDAPTTGTTKFWTLWDVVPVDASELEAGSDTTWSGGATEQASPSAVSAGEYIQSLAPGGVRTFTLEELSQATDTFSRDNYLGGGGFGSVYRGFLADGDVRDVAVKKLEPGKNQGEPEFRTEIYVLSRIHHKNLVSMVGYCISGLDRLLVYEYVENNNLAEHLRGNAASVLGWPTRMKIALGSAKGIAYLHEDCHPFQIIHQDIKSLNILLDSNFGAKVSDFGLAKCVLDDNTHVTKIQGTHGYLDPEFISTGRVTDKSDVYSFGVVLLELITGRRPIDLAECVIPFLEQALEDKGFETKLIDPKLADNYDHDQVNRVVACAAVSVRRDPDSRPRMSQVVRVLEGNTSVEILKAQTSTQGTVDLPDRET